MKFRYALLFLVFFLVSCRTESENEGNNGEGNAKLEAGSSLYDYKEGKKELAGVTRRYLIELTKMENNVFTDGYRFYMIDEEGTVFYWGALRDTIYEAPLGYFVRSEPIIPSSFVGYDGLRPIIFVGEVDGWHFYLRYQNNAGSGEIFWFSDYTCILYAINHEIYLGDPVVGFRDFGDLRVGYAQIHDGRIYFLDLVFEPHRSFYVGFGWVSSMNPDGSDIRRVVEDEVRGEFFVIGERIYFLNAESLVMYSINRDGTDRVKLVDVGEHISLPWEMFMVKYGNFILLRCNNGDLIIMGADGSSPVAGLVDDHGFLRVVNWNEDAVFFRNDDTGSIWMYNHLTPKPSH